MRDQRKAYCCPRCQAILCNRRIAWTIPHGILFLAALVLIIMMGR